jgi:CBS domain-containing protein
MQVRDIMTYQVICCDPGSDLEQVAALMQERDCGCIPVADDQGHALGMITDRDIAMAAAARHKALWELHAQDLLGRGLYACHPDDEIHQALDIMTAWQVHRLPVLDEAGEVKGLLSLDDVVACAERHVRGQGRPELSYDDAMQALKAVCRHH